MSNKDEKESSSTWGKRISPVAVPVCAYFLLHSLNLLPDDLDIIPRGNLKTDDLDQYVGTQLTQQLGGQITVRCPADIPMRKGEISDCIAADGYSRRIVRVTQDDSKGHFHFELTTQEPTVQQTAPGFS